MTIGVWEYQDVKKQTSHFRGYVKVYKENVLTKVYSPEVRTSKLQAKKDAELLAKKLKDEKTKNI